MIPILFVVLTVLVLFSRHFSYTAVNSWPADLIQSYTDCISLHTRAHQPCRGESQRVGRYQRSNKLGSSSTRCSHKLLYRVLRPARGQAPHRHGRPNRELHTPQKPQTGYHLLGHRYRPAPIGQGEVHIRQSVHSGRWAAWRRCRPT